MRAELARTAPSQGVPRRRKFYRVIFGGLRGKSSKLFSEGKARQIAERFNRRHGEPVAYISSVTVYL